MTVLQERLDVGVYVRLGFAGVAALLAILLAWALGVTISGAIVVPGVVMSDQQQRTVQHPVGGVLAEVLVSEGDLVAAGDVLARLETAHQRVELEVVQGDILEFALRQVRMQAEALGAAELVFPSSFLEQSAARPDFEGVLAQEYAIFDAKRTNLMAQLERLDRAREEAEQQVLGYEAQMRAMRRNAILLGAELASQRDLADRGLVPRASVVSLEKEEAVLEGQISAVDSARAEALKRISGLIAEREATRASQRFRATDGLREATSRVRGLRNDALRLESEIAQAALRAPGDGVVFGMSGHTAQSVLGPAEPLMHIVPLRGGQTVVAQVTVADVDQVDLGQPVTLRLSALDQRRTPELLGEVARIAAAPETDERSGAAFFEVEVYLPETELARLPAGARLLPGMPVETFIRTADRTPMSYLVKPVRDYFASAFREG